MRRVPTLLGLAIVVVALDVHPDAPATKPVRFALTVDESASSGATGYTSHLVVVFESRGYAKKPSDLKSGETIRFYQVALSGLAQGWNPPDKKSFTISAPEARHKDVVLARLEGTAGGAKLTFSFPFVPGGDGITYTCPDYTPLPSITFTSEELTRWPEISKTIQGKLSNPSVDDCKGTWKAGFQGSGEVEKKQEVEVVGPSCSCEATEELVYTATAKSAGGTFKAFEIVSSGGAAEVLENQGGKTPRLRLRGDGKSTGKTTVTAVYLDKTKTIKSAPLVVHFAAIGEVIEVNSSSRVAAHEYVFSGKGRTLEMPLRAKAWLDGANAGDRLTWEIEERGTALFEKEKAGDEGVRFVAKALPEKNDAMGPRNATARLEAEGCSCPKKHPVKLFFARDERNNPGGETPNWEYYWSQTSAGRDFSYSMVGVIPPSWAHKDAPPNAAARYDAAVDTIFIRDVLLKIGCAPRPDGVPDKGIDCYAVTLRHETHHRQQFLAWWGEKLADHQIWDPRDPDGDYVPNEVEEEWGCDWMAQKSCPGLPKHLLKWDITDIETTAYEAGWKWAQKAADKEDWGCPGRQTKGCGAE